jgi:hypothetical protein
MPFRLSGLEKHSQTTLKCPEAVVASALVADPLAHVLSGVMLPRRTRDSVAEGYPRMTDPIEGTDLPPCRTRHAVPALARLQRTLWGYPELRAPQTIHPFTTIRV